jgi:hypothetical protein
MPMQTRVPRLLLIILAATLPLGACMTAAQQARQIAADDDAACRDAGTKPGTPAYAKCRDAMASRRAMAQSIEAQAMQRQMWELQQMNTRQWMSRPM